MQRKNKLIFKEKQDLIGTTFCGGRIFSRKCSKSSVFIDSISWNCIQYIFISRGVVFLMRKEYLKQDSKNILRGFDPLISLITLIWKFLGLPMTTVYIRMHWCQGHASGCVLSYLIRKNIVSIWHTTVSCVRHL